jgi:hypothetical protein
MDQLAPLLPAARLSHLLPLASWYSVELCQLEPLLSIVIYALSCLYEHSSPSKQASLNAVGRFIVDLAEGSQYQSAHGVGPMGTHAKKGGVLPKSARTVLDQNSECKNALPHATRFFYHYSFYNHGTTNALGAL